MKSEQDNMKKNVHGDLVSGDQIYLEGNVAGSGIVIGHGTKAYIRSAEQAPALSVFASVYERLRDRGERYNHDTLLLVERLEWALDTGAGEEQLYRWLQQLASADDEVFGWVSEALQTGELVDAALLEKVVPEQANGGNGATAGDSIFATLQEEERQTVEDLAHGRVTDAQVAAEHLQHLSKSYPDLRLSMLGYLLEAPETPPAVRVIARQILK